MMLSVWLSKRSTHADNGAAAVKRRHCLMVPARCSLSEHLVDGLDYGLITDGVDVRLSVLRMPRKPAPSCLVQVRRCFPNCFRHHLKPHHYLRHHHRPSRLPCHLRHPCAWYGSHTVDDKIGIGDQIHITQAGPPLEGKISQVSQRQPAVQLPVVAQEAVTVHGTRVFGIEKTVVETIESKESRHRSM
jgi:hypothetical protein